MLNFKNTPIRTELQKYFQMPVFVENSANCVALAESVTGAAEDINFSITIKIGNGIGSGVIINNRIYSGFNFAGAEMGHMVIAFGGEQCTCGRMRLLGSVCLCDCANRSKPERRRKSIRIRLINKITEGDLSRITVATPFEAARRGDAAGKEVLERYLEYLGEGIVNIVNILMPEVIIISG